MVSTDPNDPSFGLETDQSSPSFGLAPEHTDPSTTQKIISGLGEGLGVIQKAQQAVIATPTLLTEALTPEPVKQFMRSGLLSSQTLEPVTKVALAPLRGLANIAFGSEATKEPFDTAGKAISELVSSQTSPENLAVIAGTAGAGALESTLAKRAPSLAETIFGTKPKITPEVAPEAMPQTPEPLASEVAAQQPIIPEVNTPESLATEARAATGDTEVPNFNPHGTEPGQEVAASTDNLPTEQENQPIPQPEQPSASGITPEAQNLVDSGGVPGFVSKNLERIASENGITDIGKKTPNQIIDELKSKSAPASESGGATTAEPLPKEAPTEAVEPPRTGVSSQRFTEQYGEDAPVPNTGRSASELKAIGQSRLDNYQKAGGVKDDPYSVLTNLREGKVPVSQLADDVSLLRAEHQRLKSDARNAEGTPEWEAKSQASLDMAKAIKEVAHGPASDMMRSFQEYDKPRYDNVTDFDQALREREGRESTSLERVKFKEMADDVTNTRKGKEEAINGVQKRLSKMPKMEFEDAYKNIHDQLSKLTENCIVK